MLTLKLTLMLLLLGLKMIFRLRATAALVLIP